MYKRFGIIITSLVFTGLSAEFFGCNNTSLSWRTCRNTEELFFQSCINGTWNAVCLKSDNIVLRDKLNFYDASSGKPLLKLVDGNDGTHVSIKANETVHWTVNLEKLYYIYSIVIVTYNSYPTFLPQVTTVFQLKSNETRISECELLSQPEMQNQYICYCFGTFEATVRGILSHQVNVYMRNQHPKSQTIEVAQIKLYENQGIACGTPANIINGKFSLENQGQMKNVYLPGTRITYRCNEGFQLENFSIRKPVTRTCMPYGSWNGTAPICINTSLTTDRNCSTLDVPLHGALSNQHRTLDGKTTIFHYSCKEGYKLVTQNDKQRNNGDLQVNCDKGRWNPSSQSAPVCQRIHCSYPEEVNGTFWILVNQTTVESAIAVYQCLNSSNNSLPAMTRACNPTGMWTNLTRGVNCSHVRSEEMEIARLETYWVVLPLVALCILAIICVTYNYHLWQQRISSWFVRRLKIKNSSSQQLSKDHDCDNVEEGEVAFFEEKNMDALTHQISTTSSRYSRYSDHTYERISLLVPPPDSENEEFAIPDSIYAKVMPRSQWMDSSLHRDDPEEDDSVVE